MRIDVPAAQAHDPYGYATENLAPEIMKAGGAFSFAVYRHSKLSLREFEGARARTAEINGCTICQQFRAARDLGGMFSGTGTRGTVVDNGPAPDEAFYAAVTEWRTSPIYSDRERLAIEFAERFGTEPKSLASDEEYWAKARAAFTDAEIADLANSVAAWVGLGRVAHVLGFDEVCLPFTAQAEAAE
ncbi:carboxymuconolactone decarboxylase family protein [Rhizorhabdus sp.]|jgi:alkylhydroperoxidase family enzyme|uniref:carboxymuconolactone decarboxylase family protein n=1 Tax=Rhizorhabdus sp. TaxID=1968843 RepID=UPI001B42BA31|nr:carboxymuconolactone decarboxylase family protein [Rhizorhabdus sp.]MBP8232521.1 carboxymuconolactone decarboxylase family protein [Rhizorhabdus sp.]